MGKFYRTKKLRWVKPLKMAVSKRVYSRYVKKGWLKPKRLKKRKYRGRYYKKKGGRGRKSFSRAMIKKVAKLPLPALDTAYDAVNNRYGNTQGGNSWDALARVTSGKSIVTGFTCSADDKFFQMKQANQAAVKPTGWVLGRSKVIISSWEQIFKFRNISNQDLSITFYTFRLKSDVAPTYGATGDSSSNGFINLWKDWYDEQYASAGSSAYVTYNHPAFKLTDIAAFNKYVNIKKTVTFKVLPGQEKTMRKFRRKPKAINTAIDYDYTLNEPRAAGYKGDLHYFWRVNASMLEQKDGASYALTTPAHTVYTSYHYRISHLANDDYNLAVGPTPPGTSYTLQTIFPGTSTKGDLDPAS